MKNILIIPHSPSLNVKVRSLEFAKCLANEYNIYYLTWNPYYPISFKKISLETKDFFRKINVCRKDNIYFTKISILHRPLNFMLRYNEFQIKRFLIRYHIDIVINANAYFFKIPKIKNILYIYDLVDYHLGSCIEKTKVYMENFIKDEINKADKIIVPSYSLQTIIKKEYKKESIVIPTGINLETFKNISKEVIDKIITKYNLRNKFVIGYIGFHSNWSGLEFLINCFQKIKTKETVLFIVGEGSEVDKLKNKMIDGIIFTGQISPSIIQNYFQVIDIGVLPFVKNTFTDYALPIKIIEYGAAEKITIANKLLELQKINFPYVLFAEENNVLSWIEQIRKAKECKWNSEWNKTVEQYDYNIIKEKLKKLWQTN